MVFRRLALAMLFCAGVHAQTVHPIDLSQLEDRSRFAFLAAPLRDVEVVSPGESIYLT